MKLSMAKPWQILQRVGLALVAVTAVVMGVVTLAGASPPTNGSIVPNSAVAVSPFTAGTPFSSGQQINVVIPANSVFTSTTQAINVVECTAPGGVIPTLTSQCDGNTIQGVSLNANADGSINFQTNTGSLYTVFALPDVINLGESKTGGGPACSATVQCMLYIGENQGDFTFPHVWSQPFNIVPNGDDKGENPGDGSASSVPTTAIGPQSSIVATPSTAAADGEDSSIVTVTLNGNAGAATNVPVPGKTVTLSQAGGHSVISPTSGVTNNNGQVMFTVTDATTESVTYTATDTSDSVTPSSPTDQPTVNFQAPSVATAHSTVIANPTTVSSPGGSSTITVTLRDQAANPQPVAGKTVKLVGSGSTVVISPTSATTDVHGVATFTATDSATESVTFTATDTSDSLALTSTASVTFGSLTVSGSSSTVTASPDAEVGPTGTTVVVTLLTSGGQPVSGKAVSLMTSSSTTATTGPTPAVTGTDGKATFVVTDSTPEMVTLTAKDTTDSVPLTQSPTVKFQTAAPSASASTVVASASSAPADGSTETLITVTIKDQFGNTLSGKTVKVAGNSNSGVAVHPIAIGGSSPGITNGSGQAQFEANDETAEVVTFTATDSSDSVTLTQTVQITFVAGAPDPSAKDATVVASPTQVPSNGTTPSTVTVTLTDIFGNPVSGQTISLAALSGGSQITPATAVTGTKGQALFTVTDSTAEVVTYKAQLVTSSGTVAFTKEATVTFGNPPAPPPVAQFCSVVVFPATVPADGSTTASITVLLYDGNGNAVSGKIVTLTPAAGKSTVTTVNGTTDQTGSATFTVSDTTAESVTYMAEDTTDSVTLTNLAATVKFTAASGTGTTTTTTTAGSTTSSTTTTTSGSGAGASTTTTTDPGATTTTAPPSTTAASTNGTTSGSNGSGSTGSSLAFTGVPAVAPWILGIGLACLIVGTIGRRRTRLVVK
jgi:hypothetical protein